MSTRIRLPLRRQSTAGPRSIRRTMMLRLGGAFLIIAIALNAFAWWSVTAGHEAVENVQNQGAHGLADVATTTLRLSQMREVAQSAVVGADRADAVEELRALDVSLEEMVVDVAEDSASAAVSQRASEMTASLAALGGLVDRIAAGGQVTSGQIDAAFAPVTADLEALLETQAAYSESLLEREEAAHDTGRIILILLGVMTAIGALAVVLLVARRFSGRIERISTAVSTFAEGDRSVRIDDDGDDEIGEIARSFNTMAERIDEVSGSERTRMDELNAAMEEVAKFVDAVASGDLTTQLRLGDKGLGGFGLSTNLNRMVDGLASISSEVTQGTQELSASAAQILSIVSNQNSATTEQAASISQTSVTIDEVRTNSEQVSERASGLADTANRASRIATDGDQAVDALVRRMTEIGERMDVVTVEVRELAARATAIGAINETVTDLADQSNMLALNATIEAARAGEQGRGFAVVAEQVRVLAEQSKQATMQVQAILDEIRGASSRAVEAADVGVRVVSEGRANADEAGTVIGQLADAVRETAEVAVQIASGVREQAVGMDQIGQAMGDVRDSTMKLAEGASDTEAAAGSLNALADRLALAAGRYRT